MSPALAKLASYLDLLSERKFYGQVMITFQAGEPVRVHTDQQHLVENLPQRPKQDASAVGRSQGRMDSPSP